jgi:hypothetical protein
MPSILDLFKQANSNGEVTMWNGEAQNKSLGGKIMDFVKAEINPKGPRVLFYKKLVTPPLIYGTETPRISLKGTVDPPRSLATKSARYNEDPLKKAPVSLGSLLGGSANRPSDTIFEKKDGAPVTKGTLPASVGDHSAIRYAVEADTDYFISKAPMGPNALSGVLKGDLNQMAGKAIGAGIGAAKKAIGKAVTNLVTKKRKKGQKGPKPPSEKKNQSGVLYGKKVDEKDSAKGRIKNSQYFTTYTTDANKNTHYPTGVVKREGDYLNLDTINYQILRTPYFESDSKLKETIKNDRIAAPYIKIKPYGKEYSIVFPATISGLSESLAPEWNSFKYVGSPYNTHRYNGVERTISFEFKLYYLDSDTKYTLLSSLNSLKELTFPYNQISHIKYADKDVALGFSPNLIELSINGYYKDIFGFITQLEFSVDDATSWATVKPNMGSSSEPDNQLYPTVINVSFGMTVIENHNIVTGRDDKVKVIRYNFDGMDNYTVSMKMEGLDKKDEEKVSQDTTISINNPPKITNTYVDEVEVVEENSDAIVPK